MTTTPQRSLFDADETAGLPSHEAPGSIVTIAVRDLGDLVELGRGGASVVHRATLPNRPDRAVKIYRGASSDHPATDQFRRERDAAVALPRHPAIVGIDGQGRAEDGRPFLVMELTDRTLAHRRGQPMPWAEAVPMVMQLAGALETAHRSGVLHCDVSPANVHEVDGQWKLADFGAACVDTAASRSAAEPEPVTISQAAPEALAGEPSTTARDVYGLASTLFTAIAGRPPFGQVGHDGAEVVARRVTTEPVPLWRR